MFSRGIRRRLAGRPLFAKRQETAGAHGDSGERAEAGYYSAGSIKSLAGSVNAARMAARQALSGFFADSASSRVIQR